MKLKPEGIGAAVAAASCALLGTAASQRAVAQDQGGWDVEASTLYYGEADGRVQDASAEALASKAIGEDRKVGVHVTVDALTGASPNGAAPSPQPQTVTRPSGQASYTVGAGDLPLDDTFHDTRIAADVSWTQPLGRLTTLDVGGGASYEYDYRHLGINANIAREFNRRNTTLTAGIAFSADSIDPVGGAPTPFAALSGAGGEPEDEGRAAMLEDEGGGGGGEEGGDDEHGGGGSVGPSESKTVADALLGITQVIGPRTLLQLNYSFSDASGYLNDPYKLLSVVDPVTGELAPGPTGGSGLYLFEQRPDTRTKQSLFALIKQDIGGHVLEASYRYMTDDWGIDSQTLDLHLRLAMGEGRYLQPHVRWYTQSAADFYRTVLFDGEPLPEFASADYRLAAFDGVTLGLKYGWRGKLGDWSLRAELYQQNGQASPGSDVGVLRNLDLDPSMRAVIAQFSLKFHP
jgi:hypothetical protein